MGLRAKAGCRGGEIRQRQSDSFVERCLEVETVVAREIGFDADYPPQDTTYQVKKSGPSMRGQSALVLSG
jgi:hypothetical protein